MVPITSIPIEYTGQIPGFFTYFCISGIQYVTFTKNECWHAVRQVDWGSGGQLRHQAQAGIDILSLCLSQLPADFMQTR